jgi:hypothetical protein
MTNQAPLSIDWPNLIKDLIELVIPRNDDLLSSPAKLGSLLTICVELAEIEPVVREKATILAMQKQEIPGWSLVHRDGHGYVQAERIIELGLSCPLSHLQPLVTELASLLGNISQSRYQLLCASASRVPLSEAVQQSGATVFLRRNPKQNNPER